MKSVARPSFHKNLRLVSPLLLLLFVAIQLGLLQTPALATAWQVYCCDPNTGTQMVEATVVDDTNNRELRGDYDSWYVVDADSSPDQSGYADYKATEDSTVEVYGDVNVIITDNTKWVAKRIHLNNGSKLTIWSETGNKDVWGKLSVKTTKDHKAALSVGEGSTLVINGCKVDADSDTDDAAGIGGDKNMSAGTIIINDGDVYGRSKMNAAGIGAGKRGANGGTITINGGAVKGEARDEDGAGIGGGEGGEGGTITINNGTVVGRGAEAASGIGGGCYSSAGNVTINGGNVDASGGEDAAGIGGGDEGSAGNITINGGIVTAKGGEHGAGIGCGCDAYEKNDNSLITITGGNITATGGENGAGIGSGYETNSHVINITGSGTIIQATGGTDGAGIGGGSEGRGGTITIADATVNATGMRRAAGIGGGCGYGFDTIDITNANIRAVAVFGAGIGVSGSKLFDDDAKVLSGGNISITNSTTFAASVAGGAGIGGGIFARADSITIRGGTTIAQGGSSYVHKKEAEIYGVDQLNSMLSVGFSEGLSIGIPDEVTDALGYIIGGFVFGDEVGDFLGGVIGGVVNEIASWFGIGSDKGDTIYYTGAGIGCGHGADGGTINILDRAYVQAYDGRTDHDDYKYSFAIGSGKFKNNTTQISIYDEAMVTHGKMDPIGSNKFTPVKLGVATASDATDQTSGILRDRELAQYAVIEPGTFKVPIVKEWDNRLVVPFEVSVAYRNTYYLDSTTNMSEKSETATGSVQLNKLKDWRENVVLRPVGMVSLNEAKTNGFFGNDWEQSWRLKIHYEKPITRYDEKGNLQSIDTDRYDFAVKPTRVMQDDNGSWSVFSFQRREDAQLPNGNYITEDMYNAMMEALMAEDGSATFVLTNTHLRTYSVQKTWSVDDAGQYRPESVDVVLQQKQSDGTWKTIQTKTLNDANEWKTSFDAVSDLGDSNYRIRETYNDGIVYNKGDSDIADGATQVNTYTYKGLNIGGATTDVAYDVTYETDAAGLTTITNRWQRPDTITVHGRKIWVDNKNSGKTRPTELNVYLMADGAVVRSQVIKPDDKGFWGWTFDNLPSTNSEGKAIAYTVTEDVPDGYTGVAAGKRLENVRVEEGSSEAEPADGQHIDVQNYDLANVLENRTIRGRKIWADNKNSGNTRPSELKIHLLANGTEVDSQVIKPDENNYWGWTFENLPRTNSDGKTITYTVTEDVPKGYASVAAGQRVEGAAVADGSSEAEPAAGSIEVQDYDLANVLKDSTLTISGRKIWVDNNQSEKRPDKLKIYLKADDKVVQEREITPDNNYWGWTFEDLPRTNVDGKTIAYTVTEDVPSGYTSIAAGQRLENVRVEDGSSEAVSENGQHIDVQGYDLANVLVDDPLTAVDIRGRKIWVDNKNSDNKRPSKLNIHLLADGVEVRSQVVKPDKNNYWGWTFKGLPRTNDKGQAITYTVTEGVPSGYTCVAAGQRLENVRVEEGSSEAEPADDEHIDVQGYDLANVPVNSPGVGPVDPGDDPGDPSVDPDDDDDDNKPIIPIVPIPPIPPVPPVPPVPLPDLPGAPEEEVNEKDEDEDEDENNNEKINIKVTKSWDDDNDKAKKRPTSVKVKLLADGIVKQTTTLNAANNWTHTFENQPKKVSKESQVSIVYTVTEDPVNKYTTRIERDDIQGLSSGNTCYKITNAYEDNSEKETYSVKKVWNIDAAGQDRPSVLKAVLQKQTSLVTWETAKGENGQECVVDLTAANNWEAEFPAVKKKEDGKTIKYRIRELDKDGDTVYARGDHDYQKYINKYFNEYVLRRMSALDSLTVLDCGDHLSEYLVKYAESGTRTTITNTAVMEIGIKKFWLGTDKPADDADIWNSIYLMLMSRPKAAAGGESVPYTPVYNALFGDALDGDAALNQVAGFFNAQSVLSVLTMVTGFHASDYINYGLAAAKATKDNGWQVKFGVPKYDALGQEQEYMGAEVVTGILSMAVKGVTGIDTPVMIRPIDPKFVSVFGSAIQVPVLNKDYQRSCYVINTWLDIDGDPGDPDVVLGGVKYWDDKGYENERPSSVNIAVSYGDRKIKDVTVTADNGWAWSLPLKKTDLGLQEGDVIDPAIFSIEEDVPSGYDASYSGFDVINKKKGSGDPESETRDITVKKVWKDENNKDGIRPANVRIMVKAKDEVVKNVILDQSNDWETTVTGLPKKDADGNDIDYKLEEEKTDVLTGTDSPWTYEIDVSGNADAGYVFTNKHTPADTDSQKKSVTVKKVWDDNNNQDGLRPSYVKVALKATYDGTTTTVKTVTLDELNNWQETVANLPTKWGGKQITYAWDEVVPSGYTSAQSNDGDTTTITNTHTPETISVGVRKIWKDNNDEAKKRPTTLAVTLYADGVATDKTLTLSNTASDNVAAWCGIVDNLPKYKGGKEIQYIWAEDEGALPQGYTLTKTSVSGGVTTLTNTYNATSTSTSVSKVWDDNGDTAVKRPDYVVMALYRTYKGERESAPIKRLRLRADSGWKATVSNLPMLYSDNTPVGYEWVEEPFDNGYELANTVVSGNVTTFTNAAKRSVTVSKVWKDENNFDGIRPSSVTVNLYANGTATGKSLTLDESNGWYGSFDDLAATKDGATIAYTVAEQKTSTIAGKDGVGTYSSTVSGTADSGFTITNVHTPQKTSVDVTKEWDDNNNQDGKRPANVTVRLLANGIEAKSATIAPASDGTWSYTFADLPMYQGTSKIAYTVAENNVSGYTAKVSGNATEGFTIKNTHTPEATSVSVNKVWEDANDQDGKRPNNVTVTLSAKVGGAPVTSVDGKTLTLKADDGWSGKFADLPKYQGGKEVAYTVTENKVEGYNDPQVTGSAADGFIITNTHTPETRDVAVTKVWDHGNNAQNARPTSVTIKLMADGVVKKTVQLNGTGSGSETDVEYDAWAATFKDLAKYKNGHEIVYTVSEDAVDNYATSVTGNQNKGFTFTNTYTPGKTQINVHKVWDDADDQDGIRPSSVEVALYKSGEDGSSRSVTLNAANGWSGTFSGLDPVSGDDYYFVEEEDLPDGYTGTVEPANGADGSRDFTITNTHTPQTTSVKVSKAWFDDANKEGARPEEVTVRLYANGKPVQNENGDATLVLSDKNEWAGEFTNLPAYEGGSRIAYTVTEDAVASYMTSVTGNATQGFNIANTYSTDYTSVRVIKRWDDANNQDGSRPSNVEVRLVADGKETTQVLRLSAANGWSGTFGGLPAKGANNSPISYTVTEQAVPDYTTTYEGNAANGFIITNKHTPEKTSVSVTKNWDDAENQDGVRPTSVTVYLLADGVRTGQSMELKANDDADKNWKGTFANLATGKEGAAIRYSVEEDAVAGYTSATSGSAATGFTITNTHVPQTVDVSGAKIWNDDNNSAGKRPQSITIKLLADGAQAKDASVNDITKTIGESDEWKWTFKDLPAAKDGKAITYTVEEEPVAGYETTYDRKHLNVTNTYVPTTTVTVTKGWNHDNNPSSEQPASAVVHLRANGKVVKTQTLTAGNNWTHTFTGLPTKENGSNITYTVSEEAIENYTTAITGSAAAGFSITNTYEEGKTQVSVHKVWDDDNDRDGIRPSGVEAALKSGSDTVETATLNAGNKWSHIFTVDTNKTYTVEETSELDGYESTVAPASSADGKDFTITNKHTPATVNVSGTKEWADNNNQDGLRPGGITVNLLANGTKIDDAEVRPDGNGDWTWNFTNLPKYDGVNESDQPKEITYTVTENTVPGYTTTYHAADDTTVEHGAPSGGTITNTRDPQKTSVKVTKKWDDDNNRDGKRPSEVEVALQKNGTDTGNTATLSSSNNWTYTFADLDAKENGTDIKYTVTEDVPEGMTTNYTYAISGTAAKGYVITNKHTPATVNVSGTKEWHDADNQDGIRPSSITVHLLANGEEVDHKVVRPDANGNWSWTFADVPANEKGTPIIYTVTEDTVDGYTTTYAPNSTAATIGAPNGGTIVNTHTPETRDVAVTKAWDDGNNAARPASVTVKLMADGVVKKTVQLNAGGTGSEADVEYRSWAATFKDLPKHSGGHEIVYTVAENAIENYVTSVMGNQNSGFTITNKYDQGKTQVSVHKAWNDANDQDGIRPTEVEVALKNGDLEVAKQKLNAGNGWSATFSGLDATTTYRVEEPSLPDGYTSSVEPASSADGKDFTITNTHASEKMNIVINKAWADGTTQAESVTVHLYANGRLVDNGTQTLSAGNEWKCTFTDMPIKENGAEIAYTVTEEAVAGYTSTVTSETSTSGATTTKTFTVTNTATTGDNKTQVNVVKRWDDANNQDGIRPNSVVVRLLADGKATANTLTLNADNNWSGTFQNLAVTASNGKKIAYTVVEQPVLGYAATYSGDAATGFAIVNAHTPLKTSVSVTKEWDDANNQDGKRPSSITVYLLADGVRTGQSIELRASNNWKGAFNNLAANKAGKSISYTVEEEKTSVITGKDGVGTYATSTNGDAKNGYTITNTHTPETIDVSGTKEWDDANDQDGLRPRTITIHLKKANGQEVASQTVSASTANEEDKWTWTFTDVPKYENGAEVSYSVTEDAVEGYTTTYHKADGTPIDGGAPNGGTITNTHEPQTVDVSGSKIWNDNNDQDGIRPSSITIRLLADNKEVDHKVVRPDASGKWSWTFSRVAKYRTGTNDTIDYTITEDQVAGYDDPQVTGNVTDGFTVLNTHTLATRDVQVTKIWDDDNNAKQKRPESVTFHLYADGKEVTEPGGNALTLTLPIENKWSGSFTGLPKYKDGREIVYTVTEEAAADYTATVVGNANDGFTVTNKYDEGKTQVSVHKVWDDDNDQDGIRPDKVEVVLKNGDTVVATQELNAGNNWSHTFTGLDEKDSSGSKITYTVEETSVPDGYATDDAPTGSATQGYIITNRHTPQNVNVLVNKVWDDNNNADGKRPTSVTVRLYANGRLVGDNAVTLSAESWSHEFTGLPKYENGTEIAYTVTEDAVAGYTSKVEGTTTADGLITTKTFTITNKATTGDNKTQVNVTKHWDDANNQDGLRPNAVVVSLWADGRNTGKVLLLSAANGWAGTFTNLDAIATDGAPIKYTISELPTLGYASVISGNAEQGFTISNSYTPQKTSVKVAKQWNDANNQDGFRPSSVTVHLLADGMRTGKTLELKDANKWSGTFSDLARRKAVTDIAYTVEEQTTDVITGTDAAGTYKFELSGTAADGYTIANTHTPETIRISGSKTWDDANDQDGRRPKSIKIRLIADGSQIDAKDVKPAKDGSWTWDFGERPKYKNGRQIEYRIEEDGIGGYTTTYDGFNATNTHTPETTSVGVKKTWIDDNNRDGIRPESVKVRLSAKVGDVAVQNVDGREAALEKSGNWSTTFENLPKYQGGKEVTYAVSEANVPTGYTADEPTGSAATGFTITNRHTPERTNILIKKVWNDEGNQSARPDAITFRLYANGVERRTITRTLSDWDGTVSTRDLKYEGGKEIVYTISEDVVTGYKTDIAREKSNDTTTFTVTNTHAPTRTQVSVHKVWDDNNNRDGIRPNEVEVRLQADGADTDKTCKLNANNGWAGTFEDLPVKDNSDKKIDYTVAETTVTGYDSRVTGDAKQGFTISNTHTPATVSVSGIKVWADNNNQDGKRPATVTIRLYADGEEVASKQIDASFSSSTSTNTWNWSFANLPKYDGGKEISYTVTEDKVEGYNDPQITGNATSGFTITNTHELETTAVIGRKIWNDNNNKAGKRPTSIKVTLHASPASLEESIGLESRTKTVTAANNWAWEWLGLPKYHDGQQIAYTVTEEAIKDYTTTYMGYNVINTYAEGKTSVRVTKVWDDAGNQDGIRPDEVVVSLYANGRYTGKVLRLHAAGNWAGVFSDLPAKDGDNTINYTVRERAIDGYTTTYKGSATEGFVITNTHTPEITNIPVRKVWDDNDAPAGVRPTSVIARLLVNGIWTGKICTLNADNNWKGTFIGVDKYHAGEEAKYSVSEQLTNSVPNTHTPNTYDYSVEGNATDGFTITNTYVPETVSVVGTKTWDDQGHEDKRPASITVRLYANGREVASQEVKPTEDGAWSYGFYNQPKREAGTDIVYTVSEDAVPDYTTKTSGYNITNSYTEGKTQVSVRKVWDDDNNRDNKRPGSVTVTLSAKVGDAAVTGVDGREATLEESGNWSATFTGLPKDQDGREITYAVSENKVDDYETEITGDATSGFTVTNKHTPSKQNVNIPVTVIYDDAHDQDGLRKEVFPTTVPITNGGADTGVAVDVKGDLTQNGTTDDWSGSFTYSKYVDEDLSGLQVVPATSKNYSMEVTGSATEQTGFVITYRHQPQTTQVQVKKVWDDQGHENARPAAGVTVRLYADGAPAKDGSGNALTATMADTDNWSATFDSLPKYRAGKEIDYTISEDAVANYASTISGPELSDGVNKYRVYTVTNTYTEGKTQVNVRKVWNDENDRDGIRPSSVTVKLKEGDTVTDNTLTLSATNGWAGTFTELDTTKTYSVEEEKVDGYDAPDIQSNGTGGRDFTITNTHAPQNVNVVINKVWNDKNNESARPESITLRLYADGEQIRTYTRTAADWGNQITETLPKLAGGHEIVYTVTEDTVPGYSSAVGSGTSDDGNTKTFTVTNIAATDTSKTQVNVVKRWDDANNQDGLRPSIVNVRLLANGEETGKALRLAPANAWAGSFRGLDATSSDGKDIVYTVEEDAVDGYDTSVTGDAAAGYVVTNTHVPETVTIAGSKTWDDNDDAEGARPTSITIRLSANGTQIASRNVTAADDWAWNFADLPAYKNGAKIQYTIAEDTVSDYNTRIAGYDVVNTYAPGKTQVQVHHVWDDQNDACGLRPNHVVVHLYANGKDTGLTLVLGERPSLRATANSVQSGTWSGSFDNLDINDENGRPITYTVTQSKVDYYTHSQSGDAQQGFTLVDAHDPETITLKGTKTWDDGNNVDGKRPSGVTIRLFADGVEDTSRAVYLTSSHATADNNTWTWEITGLPKYYGFEGEGEQRKEHEIVYTIKEDAVLNYSATVPEKGTLTEKDSAPDELAFNVTNTHEPWTTDVRVVKVWNDDNNRDGIQPESVTVKLLANGNDTGKSVVLNEANHWEGVFAGLSTKDNVAYTVEEQKTSVITGTDGTGTYAISTVGDAERGFTITNTHTPDKVNIAGTKVWDDDNNQDGLRPRSVSISLLANGERVDGLVVSSKNGDGDAGNANEWSWEFVNKPRRENGKDIVYTVKEERVEHYNTLVAGNAKDGFTITNTHVPGVRNVEGHKLWLDGNDQDGVRPKSVTVRLLADGQEVASKTLTAGDQGVNASVWDYSFKNVPVYDDGHEIEYTVVEDEVEGYETGYAGFNITNSHTPETVDVTVRKDWTGDEGNEAARQQVVYVQLRANNRVAYYCELSESNNWTYTFAGVPKYADGKQISYTVSENAVDNYTSSVAGSAQEGYTITNAYTPGKTQVNVYKVWDDDNDRDRVRPATITVQLMREEGEGVVPVEDKVLELNESNGWAGSFDDLPMYAEAEGGTQGARIRYSVQEISVERYESQTNGNMQEGFNLINRHEPDLVSILGAKTWVDNNNAAGVRPESIRIRLKANGDDVSGRNVADGDGWAWDFAALPKFDAGQEIAYSITEDVVDGYETTYEGYNVTNTYHPDIKSVKVTKVWNDSNNADGVRPDSVTVHLYADSVDTGLAYTLSAENKTDDNTWTFEANDLSLPATKEGRTITYALVEDAVDGYTSSVKGSIAEGFVVTNTHEVTSTPDKTMYTITYDLNGGSYNGSTDNIVEKYPAGTGILIHEAPTREGYTFTYWKGSEYKPGDAYTVTEDHTFVAQWKPNGGDEPKAPGTDNTAGGAGRTTGSSTLARTGDDSTLALVGVAIALLGASALALARRRT